MAEPAAFPDNEFFEFARRSMVESQLRLRGIGDRWNEVVIPGFDYCVVENTLGKYGTRVETLTKVPIHAQELVGA